MVMMRLRAIASSSGLRCSFAACSFASCCSIMYSKGDQNCADHPAENRSLDRLFHRLREA
jgi:hypothetical protein